MRERTTKICFGRFDDCEEQKTQYNRVDRKSATKEFFLERYFKLSVFFFPLAGFSSICMRCVHKKRKSIKITEKHKNPNRPLFFHFSFCPLFQFLFCSVILPPFTICPPICSFAPFLFAVCFCRGTPQVPLGISTKRLFSGSLNL